MPSVNAYAALQVKAALGPFQIQRREPGPHDVVIDIEYCGICHTDIHKTRDEWGGSTYPMVPGHEITGKVLRAGGQVKRHKTGDSVGVGVFIDSCRECPTCRQNLEPYCEKQVLWTYGALEKDGKTRTQGGYSTQIVVDENYVLKIPSSLSLAQAAPLLCAGITTYSPLKHWDAKPGKKVGVVGLGGLGHMAVKLAAALGAEVVVLSTSAKKKSDALKMGASSFIDTTEKDAFTRHADSFDLLINTASSGTPLDQHLGLLKRDATMVLVGLPEKPNTVSSSVLTHRRRSLAGSMIGGIKETQEMLDFCGQKGIGADVEVIPMQKVNEAYERIMKGDVRYRFVIDLASLK